MPIDDLILIPTEFESSLAQPRLKEITSGGQVTFFHCGFGPIASAAVTAELISTHRPQRVFLVGIAGAFGDDQGPSFTQTNSDHRLGDLSSVPQREPLVVGSAYQFSTVAVDGVGVGQGVEFQSARDLGWQQFGGDALRSPIGGEIELNSDAGRVSVSTLSPRSASLRPEAHRLLTVCAASATVSQANHRQSRYFAAAEDMEGFAVAMACQLQNVPLQIIRGISNLAGDRNKSNWEIASAINAAVELLGSTLGIHGNQRRES